MSPWQSCQEETVALWTQKSPCVLWSTLSWSERYSFQNEKMLPWFCSFLTYFLRSIPTYIFENYQIQKWTILWFGVIVLKLYYKAIKTFLNAFKVVFSLLFFLSTHRTIMVAEQDMHHLKKGRPKYLCVEIAHILAYYFYEFNSACREL